MTDPSLCILPRKNKFNTQVSRQWPSQSIIHGVALGEQFHITCHTQAPAPHFAEPEVAPGSFQTIKQQPLLPQTLQTKSSIANWTVFLRFTPSVSSFGREKLCRMSWRNQGITGSNNIPLGKRRFGDDEGPDDFVDDRDLKRGRDPEPRSEADGPRRRKKRNRWGDASENKAAGLMGLPTAILSNMTSEQLEAYTLHLRIEEISQKLRIDDVVPADGDRYVAIMLDSPVHY